MDEGYRVIYADPPWKYNARNNPDTRFGVGAHHYELMDTGELAELPVHKLAADNCALFLWSTFPRLPDALHVMESWGFEYKTVGFVWVKLNPSRTMVDDWPGPNQINDFFYMHDLMDYAAFFGVGYYTKSNPELCLLGVRGKMKPVSNKISNLVFYQRLEHSAKPPAVRRQIERLFGDVPRIELFAREQVHGWDATGFDVDGKDIRDVLCTS